MKPEVTLICALTPERVIGRDNRLLWKLRADMLRFKELTTGHPILMGRKTWDSLGRPLPNRRNIVLTRQKDFLPEGAEVVGSVEEAFSLCPGEEEIFVIGGGEIYAATLPLATRLLLTYVEAKLAGDAYFPEFSSTDFREVSRSEHPADEKNEYPFRFVEFRRAR
jgi:dihydrofolate reductase